MVSMVTRLLSVVYETNIRRSRIRLAGDEELSARVRVLQERDECSAAIQRNSRDTRACVSNPVGLAELGR